MSGRSIRLFLVDGTPQGMRIASVGNWSGRALVCPRTDLPRLGDRAEVKGTGVYILVGTSDTSASAQKVYIGEADDVWDRLRTHDQKKEFWDWVVVFVSTDENLTKAHVRWLEGALFRDITAARRAEVENTNEPPAGNLPEADKADMETFLENVRLLLPTLGVDVFGAEEGKVGGSTDGTPVLELKWEHAKAECVVRQGRFVVKKGSTARIKEVESLPTYLREQRRRLRESGVLVPAAGKEGLLRFAQEYAFESPSSAAAAVAGNGLNGRVHWKVKGEGISYKEWQERHLASGTDKAS